MGDYPSVCITRQYSLPVIMVILVLHVEARSGLIAWPTTIYYPHYINSMSMYISLMENAAFCLFGYVDYTSVMYSFCV